MIERQIIERLGIDIEGFFEDVELSLNRQLLSERDKQMIGLFLLGKRRKQVANTIHLSDAEIGNRLSNHVYPKIAHLMQIEQAEIANNWTLILNFLLDPANGYKLEPPPDLNSDHFQGSCGGQLFLHPSHPQIAQVQIRASKRYQQGFYYQALLFFTEAWYWEKQRHGRGNPEVCIYLNNCLLETQRTFLQQRDIKIYTLAVVVPFHHNQGAIATEILRGVAQIQSIVNCQHFDGTALEAEFFPEQSDRVATPMEYRGSLFSICGSSLFPIARKIALRIMVVNDTNNVYTPYNQTAEKLAALADEIELVAVVGHYSSEMTQAALNFYAEKGIILVNASSTSNQLSHLEDSIGFYRLTTQDRINAAYLVEYLVATLVKGKIAIIYNEYSSYSCSYRNSVKESLVNNSHPLELYSEYGQLGGDIYGLQDYLQTIQGQVDGIVLIPDGGIEPNSLHNIGLISRLSSSRCLIAGSATFYQENVLHWMQEGNSSKFSHSLVACVPWHWDSPENGGDSANAIAQIFCQMGTDLWGHRNLTWRSATAFDAVLLILKSLERHSPQQKLMVEMRKFFKVQRQSIQGVTGLLQFHENGDRVSPPAEIVTVAWDQISARWQWQHLQSLSS